MLLTGSLAACGGSSATGGLPGPVAVTQACSSLPDSTAAAQNPGLPGRQQALTGARTSTSAALTASPAGTDLPAALRTARLGPDRASAEKSARDFLTVLLDTRPALTGKQLVCSLASPELSPAVAAFLAVERNMLRDAAGPANRRIAAKGGGFYRSVAVGGEAAPSAVQVELAVPVQLDKPRTTAWTVYRLDVRPQRDLGWRLADFYDGGAGPSGLLLSPTNQARLLTGTGWRPLGPPA